jgi:hypothetical protein
MEKSDAFSILNTQKQKFLVPRKSEDFLGFIGNSK